MFLIDDLLIRPFFSLLDILQTMALDEMYDTSEIKDNIKENRLLYEIGERPEEEYQTRKEELELQLEVAEQIQAQLGSRIEVKR
jgi:serine phosphatase RsbU (regulator of sigma subunit)